MLTFCYGCRKYVPFRTAKKKVTVEIEGKNYEIDERVAYCEKCNQEVFVKEIEDDNYVSLDKYYRETNKVVTPNEIKEVLHKYNISKKNLSLLLSLDEEEIYDYIEGKIPSKDVSSLIKGFRYSPSRMMKRLEDYGSNLIEDDVLAIAESIRNVDSSVEYVTDDKIEDVYFKIISLTPDITITAAMKLIYYSYGFYYAIHNKRLFGNLPSAWVNGPVYSKLFRKYKKHEYVPSTTEVIVDRDFKYLNENETEVIKQVVKTFGVFSGDTLSTMTKQEYPWLVTRDNTDSDDEMINIIKDDDIRRYFNEVSLKFGILTPEDISRYCEFIYDRIKN